MLLPDDPEVNGQDESEYDQVEDRGYVKNEGRNHLHISDILHACLYEER